MHPRTIAFLSFNGLGIAYYLFCASTVWLKPVPSAELGISAGDAAIYIVCAIPTLVGCSLLDLLWVVLEIELAKKVPRGLGPAFLVVLPLWIAAACVDWLHQ